MSSLQKPQSNAGKEEVGHNGIDLGGWLRLMSGTTRCVASEACMSKTGENLESEDPEELGELTIEGGEGRREADVGL